MNQYEQTLVEEIKNRYIEKPNKPTRLDELKQLDKKVKSPAIIFAYIYGIIGALVLGVGMCLAMKVIGDLMALGIVIGVIGIVMLVTTYPLYKNILNKRRKKYSSEIISKSDALLNNYKGD